MKRKSDVPQNLIIKGLGIPKSTYYHYLKVGMPSDMRTKVLCIKKEYDHFLKKLEQINTEMLNAS